MPQSNISDEERSILEANTFLGKLLHSCMDVLGPYFVFNPAFTPHIDPTLKWII